MGKIRLSSFRRQQALPDTDTTENEKKDVEDVEHIEHIHLEEKAFPVVPRNAKDQDLQLVPASEVWKQDGKGGNRLCTHLRASTTGWGSPDSVLMFHRDRC